MADPEALRRIVEDAQAGRQVVAHGADLARAELVGLNLTKARLAGANLRGATLREVNLHGAILRECAMQLCTIIRSDLSNSDMGEASLSGATILDSNFTSAHLIMAELEEAEIAGSDFSRARMGSARMSAVKIERCKFVDTYLSHARLRHSVWREVDVRGANFSRARMEKALFASVQAQKALFGDAKMQKSTLKNSVFDGAYLVGADTTDMRVIDTDMSRATLSASQVHQVRGAGSLAGPVLKLRKHGAMPAREFKRRFPAEFERIKPLTRGRDFTPEMIDELTAAATGPSWIVVNDVFHISEQRLCSEYNPVLLFGLSFDNIPGDLHDTARELGKRSRRRHHPVIRLDDVLTVGWVRYCDEPGVWLVEEVQSDLRMVRFKKDSDEELSDIPRIDELTEAIRPWLDRFYEDALAVVFDLAQQAGVKVEMLTYASKEQFGSPRSLYEDLPRKMGMVKVAESSVLPEHPVWTYTPNRYRPHIV